MTPADAAKVLTKAAAFDQRTIGHADAVAWAEALDGVGLDDALAAVTAHYREATSRLMPADVRRYTTVISRERLRAAIEVAERGPACVHGTPGGGVVVGGVVRCALCRREPVQVEPSTSRRETS